MTGFTDVDGFKIWIQDYVLPDFQPLKLAYISLINIVTINQYYNIWVITTSHSAIWTDLLILLTYWFFWHIIQRYHCSTLIKWCTTNRACFYTKWSIWLIKMSCLSLRSHSRKRPVQSLLMNRSTLRRPRSSWYYVWMINFMFPELVGI